MVLTYFISIFPNHLLDPLRYFYDAHTTLKTRICLKMNVLVYILYQKSSSFVSTLINDHPFKSFTLAYGCQIKVYEFSSVFSGIVDVYGLRVQLFTLYDIDTIFYRALAVWSRQIRTETVWISSDNLGYFRADTVMFLRLSCETRTDRTQMLYILSYADRILDIYETWMVNTIQHDRR